MVVEAVNHEFSKRKQFSAADVNRHVSIDSTRYLRLLGRLNFLEQAKDKVDGKTTVYSRSATWPPPVEFFKGSAIGIVYYLQKWFPPYGLMQLGREDTGAF